MPEEEIVAAPPAPDVEAAQRLVEDQEFGARHPVGPTRWLIPATAAAWSLFQLALPYFVLLRSDVVRSIHLAFAGALVFLSCAALKKPGKPRKPLPRFLSFLAVTDRVPVVDLVLAAAIAGVSLYAFVLDPIGVAARVGRPITRDIVVGLVLLALVLEAARRALGPALSVIAGFFLVYALFLAPYMPGAFFQEAKPIGHLIGQETMSTEGLYGIPLRVSAMTVFLFVLFGRMLEKSGGGKFFVQLAYCLVGRFKGGPAKAAVLASGLTGMVSGSSIANAVTTGTFTIPLMKKSGYPAEKAAAVEVAASTNGQLMPPIMGAAAFIIAEYCGMDYLQVVKAAFVPAVVSYLALLYITHLEASKLGLKPMPRAEIPRLGPVLRSGFHFLLPLGLLISLLVYWRKTPEYSAFWAIVALAAIVPVRNLAVAVLRGESRREALVDAGRRLWDSLVAGGRSMMGIGVACAAAGIICGVVSLGLGERITGIVESISGKSFILVLVFTAIASLVLGMGLPTTATYLVMASLIANVIVAMGAKMGVEVPPVAAHLFCFFFGILADDTPPVGLAAYAAAAVAKSKPIPTGVQGFLYDLRTAILPFFFVFNTDLLLWKITSFWAAAVVFGASTAAMFAFAALTQWYTVARNRWYESLMLALSTLVLLRPRLVPDAMSAPPAWLASKYLWYLVGVALYGAVFALQWPRRRAD
jgi:TRAP transporter 4TM/12TM fusion protein